MGLHIHISYIFIRHLRQRTLGSGSSPWRVFSRWTSSYVGSLVAKSYGGGAEKSALGGGMSSPSTLKTKILVKLLKFLSIWLLT